MRLILFIFFGFFLPSHLTAQFNINVGYKYSLTKPTIHNKIIDQINNNNSSLENYTEMKSLKSFHGIHLGSRYRAGFVGLNLDWNPKFQLIEFDGINPLTDANEFRKLYYRFDSYSLGVEFFIKQFSFGASYDWNKIRIRSEYTARTDRHDIFNAKSTSSHFFVSLNVYGNENLTLAFQPYVQIPWTNFNLTNLENDLNTGVNLSDYEDGFLNYGLKLVFQNGNYKN
ncbi:hypothetical protein OAG16_00185 [Saprospiraceae bacterium]|jgi:hypothetical protein|nr:hypothetical protein [Saprospiraceae bacterium]MDC3210705.1 hypothetical protein [Saprospiraceae bacterium]MDG1432474.1 hypothetical protein [Saprospiraceae bacterium]